MSIKTLVDQSQKDPKITLRLEFNAKDNEHAKEVDKLAKKCASELALAMVGQLKLTLDDTAAKPVKGQKKMDLGPNGEVLTPSDKKAPGDFVPDEVVPGEIAAKGEAFLHGKDKPVARPFTPEPTGPLGETVKAS